MLRPAGRTDRRSLPADKQARAAAERPFVSPAAKPETIARFDIPADIPGRPKHEIEDALRSESGAAFLAIEFSRHLATATDHEFGRLRERERFLE